MKYLTKDELAARHYTASYELEDVVKDMLKNMNQDEICLHLAYSDYGGSTIDQALIGYLKKNYKDQLNKTIFIEDTRYYGQNCFVFGDLANTIKEETENYILGFQGLEEYYSQLEYKAINKTIKDLKKDFRKDYVIKRNGLDQIYELARDGYIQFHNSFNYPDYGSSFIKRMEAEGLIEKRNSSDRSCYLETNT